MTALRLCLLTALLAGGIGLRPAARAEDASGELPPGYLRDLVRTDDGAIWGIVPSGFRDDGSNTITKFYEGGPYLLENGHWRPVPTSGLPERSKPYRQIRRADGAVVCLWGDEYERRTFTVQSGKEFKAAATVMLAKPDAAPAPGNRELLAAERDPENQRLFADSKTTSGSRAPAPKSTASRPTATPSACTSSKPRECRGRPIRHRREEGTTGTRWRHSRTRGAVSGFTRSRRSQAILRRAGCSPLTARLSPPATWVCRPTVSRSSA